jgi:hypothetical protein
MDRVNVFPKILHGPLPNPGIGFMTFQRFNGDTCNPDRHRWTEGHPIEYQPWSGQLTNPQHPDTTLAYFRVYWHYIEPEKGVYRWDIIDKALETAHKRGQTLLLRLPPHGHNPTGQDATLDLPGWFKEIIGPKPAAGCGGNWLCDCNDPLYAEYYGGYIREAGRRYNGHPDLESVDMGLIGPWGEGAGARFLKEAAMRALCDAYIDSFPDTWLLAMLGDNKSNEYILSRANAGYRADCLGDMRSTIKDPLTRRHFDHMKDRYPQQIVAFGVADCWKTAPVSFEACHVLNYWFDHEYDLDYIIEESLKWHISSFNGKSNTIPEEWTDKVQGWIDRMGYRITLRRINYARAVKPGGPLTFDTWWQNIGCAPCYKKYPLAFRLKNDKTSLVFNTGADITKWLPGDSLYDDRFYIPWDMPTGDYQMQLAFLDSAGQRTNFKPFDGRQTGRRLV